MESKSFKLGTFPTLSMGVYVDATTEDFYIAGERPVYYEDVTVYFDAENVGETDQALTAFYFSWRD